MISGKTIDNLINLGFSANKLKKLSYFHDQLLIYNRKYNLISQSTESMIWSRHILDSAQLIKYIKFGDGKTLADLGSGAGFPGLILSIFNQNSKFHVKLYEKSSVKCDFLINIIKKLNITAEVISKPIGSVNIKANYVVCRAFKKLGKILDISREIINKPHELIILKGKNAQEEINYALKNGKFEYRLESSMTDKDSKIIVMKII